MTTHPSVRILLDHLDQHHDEIETLNDHIKATADAVLDACRAGHVDTDTIREIYWSYPDIHVRKMQHALKLPSVQAVIEIAGPGEWSHPCSGRCGETIHRSETSRTSTKNRRDLCPKCAEKTKNRWLGQPDYLAAARAEAAGADRGNAMYDAGIRSSVEQFEYELLRSRTIRDALIESGELTLDQPITVQARELDDDTLLDHISFTTTDRLKDIQRKEADAAAIAETQAQIDAYEAQQDNSWATP
jgi:predicted RNA-binding Zn-ribbon protein involved in translation (DUF1610 family)